jgi:hypothetical protein
LLAGGAIGGVSVFAIDSALTAPPHQDLRAETSLPNAPSPIRTIDAPALNPSPAAATPAPVQAQTAPSVQPQTAALVQPTPQTQVQAAPEVTGPQTVVRTAPAKRRVLISRMKQPKGDTVSDSAETATAAKGRRVYDYYGDTRTDEDRNEQGVDTTSAGTPLANVHLPHRAHDAWNATPKTRVVTRRQVPAYPDRSN